MKHCEDAPVALLIVVAVLLGAGLREASRPPSADAAGTYVSRDTEATTPRAAREQ